MSGTLVLGDALELLIDNRGKNPPYQDEGIPVVSGMSVQRAGLDLSRAKRASIGTWKKWMPTPTRPGDIVLTSEAPLGRVVQIRSEEPIVIGQRVFCLRGRDEVLDTRFLYYALQTELVQADLSGRATGTTVVGIRQPELRKVRIPDPGYARQIAIGQMLGALDDKIAGNDHLGQILLVLADAEFSSAVGSVVVGGKTFGDVAAIAGGGTPSTSTEEFWNGDVPWATPTDLTGLRFPYLTSTSRKITEDGLANCSSRRCPTGSILMTSRATIGAFAVAQVPVAVNQGFIVVNAHESAYQWWLFHEMRSRVSEFISHANGATFLELSRGKFKQFPVRLPGLDQARAFAGRVGPIHELGAQLLAETAALIRTRDELLPLLMSGKVHVRDAENAVSDVL